MTNHSNTDREKLELSFCNWLKPVVKEPFSDQGNCIPFICKKIIQMSNKKKVPFFPLRHLKKCVFKNCCCNVM